MSELQQGLLIAAIGMGLVFTIIIFLWGLMALMMRVTSQERTKVTEETSLEQQSAEKLDEIPALELQRRAIAAAVAVGLAIETSKKDLVLGKQGGDYEALSPWQTVHRNRQIENKRTQG